MSEKSICLVVALGFGFLAFYAGSVLAAIACGLCLIAALS